MTTNQILGDDKEFEVFYMTYDDPLDKDGSPKDNKSLGKFTLVEGNMDGYDYEAIVKDNQGKIYVLTGKEVSGYYNPGRGGIRNSISLLSEDPKVIAYIKHCK